MLLVSSAQSSSRVDLNYRKHSFERLIIRISHPFKLLRRLMDGNKNINESYRLSYSARRIKPRPQRTVPKIIKQKPRHQEYVPSELTVRLSSGHHNCLHPVFQNCDPIMEVQWPSVMQKPDLPLSEMTKNWQRGAAHELQRLTLQESVFKK